MKGVAGGRSAGARPRAPAQADQAKARFLVLRMNTLVIEVVVVAVAVACGVGLGIYDRARRAAVGVKAGVTLEGRSVAGLLESEVRQLVLDLEAAVRRDPQDAVMYEETGELLPSRPGVEVDTEATVERVMSARPNQQVRLVTVEVLPAVTERHFTPTRRVETETKTVAFAVNVEDDPESVKEILRQLVAAGKRATFFVTGQFATRHPESVTELGRAGMEVGNHGLEDVRPPSTTELRDSIARTEEALRKCGVYVSNLFAPPLGECDSRTVSQAARLGYRTILYSVDAFDWKLDSPVEVASRVRMGLHPGAIVLLHATPTACKALPDILAHLTTAGYACLTVGELLQLERPTGGRP